jgi:hypothetical protein
LVCFFFLRHRHENEDIHAQSSYIGSHQTSRFRWSSRTR